jgi:glutaminyl-peptide cyclotransferase
MADRVALLAVVVACALAGCGSDTSAAPMEPAVPAAASARTPTATVNRFDGGAAFSLLREQVQHYGWRPAGSAALRRLAVPLRLLMPRGRFEDLPGHPGLRNVVGSVPGRMPAIVVGAHYDVEAAPKGFVGANDGAAGTAAVVTLARAFARAPRPRDARALRFVLFDGEEEPAGCEPFVDCGIRGSKAYARRHRGETRALVLLDYIAEKQGLRFTREAGSDPALWERLRRAAGAAGVGELFSSAVSGEIIDDHWPFTRRGVPAIDVIDFDYPQRDSLEDDLDAVARRSIDAVGEAVYRLVARLRAARDSSARTRG